MISFWYKSDLFIRVFHRETIYDYSLGLNYLTKWQFFMNLGKLYLWLFLESKLCRKGKHGNHQTIVVFFSAVMIHSRPIFDWLVHLVMIQNLKDRVILDNKFLD